MPPRLTMSLSGRARARAFARRHRWLVVLLLADIATKVAAFRLLPEGQAVTVIPGLRFYLAVNEWGVMGGVHGIGRVTDRPAYTMLLALGLVAFAEVVRRLGASSLAFGWRLLAGLGAFLAMALAVETLAAVLARVGLATVGLAALVPSTDLLVGAIRAAVLLVALALYCASRATFPRVAFTLLAAGALANAASSLYPPYEVIDFLVVPIAPFLSVLGRSAAGAADADIGVINLADVYLFAFPLLMLAWLPAVLLRRVRSA